MTQRQRWTLVLGLADDGGMAYWPAAVARLLADRDRCCFACWGRHRACGGWLTERACLLCHPLSQLCGTCETCAAAAVVHDQPESCFGRLGAVRGPAWPLVRKRSLLRHHLGLHTDKHKGNSSRESIRAILVLYLAVACFCGLKPAGLHNGDRQLKL